jgi:hypothetical protein
MAARTKIGFDTNPINLLLDDPESSYLLTAIRLGYDVVLPALTFEEILSVPTARSDRREQLVGLCEKLLGSGKCLFPFHWTLTKLIEAHHKSPTDFDWTKVSVRAHVYENAIRTRNYTEDMCAVNRDEQLEIEKKSKALWRSPRAEIDMAFELEPDRRPKTFRECVDLTRLEGSNFWQLGAGLYTRIAGAEMSEKEFWDFLETCPPFRAFYYSILYRWFDGALKSKGAADLKPSGRNDLAMSVYLPYCQKFIADEGAQTPNLREVAREAEIDCEILNYREFSASFNPISVARA